MLWFVIAALLEEKVPNALMANNGYIFDYVVGKQKIKPLTFKSQKGIDKFLFA